MTIKLNFAMVLPSRNIEQVLLSLKSGELRSFLKKTVDGLLVKRTWKHIKFLRDREITWWSWRKLFGGNLVELCGFKKEIATQILFMARKFNIGKQTQPWNWRMKMILGEKGKTLWTHSCWLFQWYFHDLFSY